MTSNLCSKCEISLNFSVNKIPPHFDYKLVSTSKNNEVLREILENKNKIQKPCKFLILVDVARYGIEVMRTTKDTVLLKQFVLHYNGKELVPVYVRFVKIIK